MYVYNPYIKIPQPVSRKNPTDLAPIAQANEKIGRSRPFPSLLVNVGLHKCGSHLWKNQKGLELSVKHHLLLVPYLEAYKFSDLCVNIFHWRHRIIEDVGFAALCIGDGPDAVNRTDLRNTSQAGLTAAATWYRGLVW